MVVFQDRCAAIEMGGRQILVKLVYTIILLHRFFMRQGTDTCSCDVMTTDVTDCVDGMERNVPYVVTEGTKTIPHPAKKWS